MTQKSQLPDRFGRYSTLSCVRPLVFWACLCLSLMLSGDPSLARVTAQDDPVVLTPVLTEGIEYLEDARLFEQFEEDNPGIKVHVVYSRFEDTYIPRAAYGLEDHLQKTEAYTLWGDVLMSGVGGGIVSSISIEATRAGYY